MLDTKEKPVEGKVTEPSKRWVNRYKALIDGYTTITRRYVKAGDCYNAVRQWPTKDVAETRAQSVMAATHRRFGRAIIEYLGAFEVKS